MINDMLRGFMEGQQVSQGQSTPNQAVWTGQPGGVVPFAPSPGGWNAIQGGTPQMADFQGGFQGYQPQDPYRRP